jgi:predicted lipid-binding transport protein (Tim44 family)
VSFLTKVCGGILDFVSNALNAIFRMEASQNPSLRAWTGDDFVGAGAPALADGADAPAARPLWEQAQTEIAALQKIDPNFSDVAFLSQASRCYTNVLDAEGAMNADAVAKDVTPEFLARLRQQLATWAAGGLRRVAKDLKLDGGSIYKISVDGNAQCITVRFTGAAVRCTEDSSTGAALEGSLQSESFTEYATYQRPAGSTTPQPVAAGAPAHCPACGAPAEAGSIYCTFCGTPLTGTGGTWRLDRISQSAYT